MNIQKWLTFIIFTLALISRQVVAVPLSPDAQISLLTCTPGNEVYSIFGHSALRVQDSIQGLDQVYNYGTFDFNTPNFYLKFLRGQLDYKLDQDPFRAFIRSYTYQQRGVVEKQLNLSPSQKQSLFDFLENNSLPENAYYRYDFFFDNCATRIRDAVEKAAGGTLSFRHNHLEKEDYTFRQLLGLYINKQPWLDFGMNLLLGKYTDRLATPREYMFLPDFLDRAFMEAFLQDTPEATLQPLVKQNITLLPNEVTPVVTPFYSTPLFVFGILALVIAALSLALPAAALRWFDVAWFGLLGLVGVLLVFMWFGTDHQPTSWNYNLLWANPLWLGLPILLYRRSRRAKYIFLAVALCSFFTVVGWRILPQVLPWAGIPLTCITAIRASRWFGAD